MKKTITLLLVTLSSSIYTFGKDITTTYQHSNSIITISQLMGKWKLLKGEYFVNNKLEETQDLQPEECDSFNYYELFKNNVAKEVQIDQEDCSSMTFPSEWNFNPTTKLLTIKFIEKDSELKATVILVTKSTLKIQLIDDTETEKGTYFILNMKKQ